MSAKRNKKGTTPKKSTPKGHIKGAGIVRQESITHTLETNYMPYAMSVIVSRAIPEIDGFKPAHRKILYMMYTMGLLKGARTKSANVVGSVMKLNPHGDQAIYETMVRLSKGNEALLHPFIDSKGNFGKSYSRDMDYAASRYTEVKLDPICTELFQDIEMNTVDFRENYDNTMLEPTLLPTTFPTILVNANMGIAVGMASSICPFNLSEVCETTINIIKNPNHNILDTLKAPDFPGGGFILFNSDDLEKIYNTGRGGIRVRCKYSYDKSNNCIDITQIPPSTTVEAIIDKIIDLSKQGKIKEISDIRDETDLSGLKLTLDLKRGIDAEKLMQKLYRLTPLEDTFSCNFNILINGTPQVMGVSEIINEWIIFRKSCIKRKVLFDLNKKNEKLHLLNGLSKILLDIDKAIKIIRETDEEHDVIPNLMIGFGIDEIQAEYVAEIKLRHLNKAYILKRTSEIAIIEDEILNLKDILQSDKKIDNIIIKQLKDIIKKYGQERKSLILTIDDNNFFEDIEETPDYPVNLFLTEEGYFKKITPQSLRMSSDHKLKENDKIISHIEATNNTELLFFTNQCQVYKSRASEFDDTKASVLGEYIPAKLSMDEGENIFKLIYTSDYSGFLLFFFENGKVAKVPLISYFTKTKRKKLINAYTNKSKLINIIFLQEDADILIKSTNDRYLLFNSSSVPEKNKKDTIGISIMNPIKNHYLEEANIYHEGDINAPHRFRTKTLPARGAFNKVEADQLNFEN